MSDDLEERLESYKERLDSYAKKLKDLEENETIGEEEKLDMLIQILSEINDEKTKQ